MGEDRAHEACRQRKGQRRLHARQAYNHRWMETCCDASDGIAGKVYSCALRRSAGALLGGRERVRRGGVGGRSISALHSWWSRRRWGERGWEREGEEGGWDGSEGRGDAEILRRLMWGAGTSSRTSGTNLYC
eukprot:937551-Rhodomonas_salina.1